jgi:hypothetical protein
VLWDRLIREVERWSYVEADETCNNLEPFYMYLVSNLSATSHDIFMDHVYDHVRWSSNTCSTHSHLPQQFFHMGHVNIRYLVENCI